MKEVKESDVDSIIAQVDKTYKNINSLAKTVKITYGDGNIREYNIFFKKPFKAKVEFVSPSEEKGFNIWVYEDGIWHINEYNEETRTLNSFDISGKFEGFEEFQIENLKPDLKRYLIEQVDINLEEDILNSKKVYKLIVTPSSTSEYLEIPDIFTKTVLYIDQETFLILKNEGYHRCPETKGECLLDSRENLNLKVNVEISDEIFDIGSQNLPEGVVTVHEPFPVVAEEESKPENELCIPDTTGELEFGDQKRVDIDNNKFFVRIAEIKEEKVSFKINDEITYLLTQGEFYNINDKLRLLVLLLNTSRYIENNVWEPKVKFCFIS